MSELPPFLCNSEPLEPEDMPLQLALLTMEAASCRTSLALISETLDRLAKLSLATHKLLSQAAVAITPPGLDLNG